MPHYEIKVIKHKNLQGVPVAPVYAVSYMIDGEVIFTSHNEGVAEDIKYLLDKARLERLPNVFEKE